VTLLEIPRLPCGTIDVTISHQRGQEPGNGGKLEHETGVSPSFEGVATCFIGQLRTFPPTWIPIDDPGVMDQPLSPPGEWTLASVLLPKHIHSVAGKRGCAHQWNHRGW
jgi:hypothetical protein